MTSSQMIGISASEYIQFQKQFRMFCESHPNHQVVINGHKWSYLLSGQGSQMVVLIHSAAAGAESLFSQIKQLETDYMVLAPTIPCDIRNMRDACDGLKALLNHEQIQTFHIVGYSVGGMLAQCFLWRYPALVKSIMLSHTILPTVLHAEGLHQALIEYGTLSDEAIIEGAMQIFRERHKKQPLPLDPIIWKSNYVALEEMFRTGMVHKADLLSWLALEEDYHRNYAFHQDETQEWNKSILIIESDADEVYNLLERKFLKEAYPDARIHTFHGWGHLGILATGPVIQTFLQSIFKQTT